MLTPRPMRQIYLEAANAAKALHTRAVAATTYASPADKLKAQDIAYAAKRFSVKADKAADDILTFLDDGTLKIYCEQFDKVFERFCKNASTWEAELAEIECRSA